MLMTLLIGSAFLVTHTSIWFDLQQLGNAEARLLLHFNMLRCMQRHEYSIVVRGTASLNTAKYQHVRHLL
jgi:hypothetical protein